MLENAEALTDPKVRWLLAFSHYIGPHRPEGTLVKRKDMTLKGFRQLETTCLLPLCPAFLLLKVKKMNP